MILPARTISTAGLSYSMMRVVPQGWMSTMENVA
jgi:hypothetical protein